MRNPSLVLAVWLALAPATGAEPAAAPPTAQADWRRDGVDERLSLALTGRGWRLEDDGRAWGPAAKAPASKVELDKAVLDLRQGARRAALEKVRLLLSSGKPLGREERDIVASMSADIPPALAAAVLDPKSDPSKLKALADADLSRTAAYFDGSRSPADLEAAARPVSAGSPRAAAPYFDAREKAAGVRLRAAALGALERDPFGKTVLARLAGKNGRPDLPAMLVSALAGGAAAGYDPRRRTVVIDRERLLASIVEDEVPTRRAALRASLSSLPALLDYVAARPDAAASFARKNDVLLVHELTHAWQDRRDPVLREIARGNLPEASPLEYENEAFMTQTLFLHSRLTHDPASVHDDDALAVYAQMMHGRASWWRQTEDDYRRGSPAFALNAEEVMAIQRRRLDAARSRPAGTDERRRERALEIAALTSAGKAFDSMRAAQEERLRMLMKAVDAASAQSRRRLEIYHHLRKAQENRP